MSGSSGMSLPQERSQAVTKPPSPTRARHQLQRSITEIASPVRLGKHHHHHRHNHHTPHAPHRHSTRQKKYSIRDDRNMSVPQSAAPVLQLPRVSLDAPRAEGVNPRNISPTPSPRGSLFFNAPGSEIAGGLSALAPGESREEALRREKERAEARTACVVYRLPPDTQTRCYLLTFLLSYLQWPPEVLCRPHRLLDEHHQPPRRNLLPRAREAHLPAEDNRRAQGSRLGLGLDERRICEGITCGPLRGASAARCLRKV